MVKARVHQVWQFAFIKSMTLLESRWSLGTKEGSGTICLASLTFSSCTISTFPSDWAVEEDGASGVQVLSCSISLRVCGQEVKISVT